MDRRRNRNRRRSIITDMALSPVTKIAAGAVLLLWVAACALGQIENRKLVIGSAFRVVRNLIEVKREDGDFAVILVTPATAYTNSSTQARGKLKGISVGDQIVVKVITKDGVETADQVKFVPTLGARS